MQNIAKFLFIVLVFTAVSYPSSQFSMNQQTVSANATDNPYLYMA